MTLRNENLSLLCCVESRKKGLGTHFCFGIKLSVADDLTNEVVGKEDKKQAKTLCVEVVWYIFDF